MQRSCEPVFCGIDRNLTILIAEDDENYSLLVEKALRANGLTNPIHIVPDGEAVIEYLKGSDKYKEREVYPFPSVMFIDIKMPRASGFDVLRWVRKHPEYMVLPTMMFSSSAMEDDVKLAYQLGANAYFLKPATFTELKTMLQTAYEFWSRCEKPAVTWQAVMFGGTSDDCGKA